MPAKKDEILNFEQALIELDSIVELMEAGGLSLDESLKQFEKGIKLTRQCQAALQEAEQKVKILLQKNATETLEPYKDGPTE